MKNKLQINAVDKKEVCSVRENNLHKTRADNHTKSDGG